MEPQFSPEAHQIPAAEMNQLESEVKKHVENPENKMLSGHEIVKKSIQTMTFAPAPQPQKNAADAVLPDYAQSAAPSTKLEIEHLLGVVLREGILKGSEEAMKSNPFVLDAFHDALAGKLYPELQKRGIVK